MKRIFIYTIGLMLIGAACTKDKGSYDYELLNEVVISNIQEEYIALSEAPFSISPTIEQKENSEEKDLGYLWYAYNPKSQSKEADTLAFTKNLSLDSLNLTPRDYQLVLRVTDKTTDIYYDFRARLVVKGFTDGLQVLSNNKGNAQVSILRGTAEGLSDFEVYKLKNNNEVAGQNPVKIQGISKFMRSGKPFRIAIFCNDDKLGTYVAGDKFVKTINVVDAFQNFDAPQKVDNVLGNPNLTTYAYGFISDNKLFSSFQPGGPYGEECRFMYTVDNISPNFIAGFSYSGYVVYNPNTKGFGKLDYWGSSVTFYQPSQDEEAPFERSNTGLDAVYGKAVGQYCLGVFMDSADNKKYILGMLGSEAVLKKEMNGPEIENATHFEFLNSKQILLYAHQKTVYTYDIVSNKVLYSYPAPEGLSIDRIQISNDDKKLFVGFSDGSKASNSGTVHILNIDLDGEILGIHEAYENKFGKIVDFYENY